MIASVRLETSGIETSRLGFGTSRLHYQSTNDAQAILSAALDLGIRHFDTAPAYGDGAAESAIGKWMAAAKRDRIVLVTKYGVPPDPVTQAFPSIAPVWRVARGAMRRTGLLASKLPALSPDDLIKSVESSLRRLRTDFVDILLLHEPTLTRLQRYDEVFTQMNSLKAKGTVRAFGLAGPWRDLAPILDSPAKSLATVVQTDELDWKGVTPDITFGAISEGRQSRFQESPSEEVATERLKAALRRRPQGVVLISTTKRRNLESLAGALECI